MYADSWVSESDEAAKNALKFYSLACEGKIYEACEALGRLYEDGEAGFAQDIKAAISYYDKACAANAAAASVWTSYGAAGRSIKAGSLRQPTS